MAERFERIFLLPNDLYIEGSPLILSAGALLMDKQIAKFLVQLKFKNIGQKTPISVTVKITEMDRHKNPLGTQTEFTYTNLSVSRDEEFGTQTPIFVGNSDTRAFDVSIQKVVFADASVFSAEDRFLTESLPAPVPLRSWLKDYEAIDEYCTRFGESACHKPEQYHDIWRCTCGSINAAREERCHSCRCAWKEISDVDLDTLKKDNVYRRASVLACTDSISDLSIAINLFSSIKEWKDSENRIAECQRRLERRTAYLAKQSKMKKRGAMITAIAVFVVAFVILLNTVIIPNGKYNDAMALMNDGKYAEAIDAFTALDGYKDSETKILDCQYGEAETLMNAEKYEEAITAFTALDGYKDSKAKIQDCQYGRAEMLMDAGKYEEAITAFTALNGYKDSAKKIQTAKRALYADAVSLYNQGNQEAAKKKFEMLGKYKDSEIYLASAKFISNFSVSNGVLTVKDKSGMREKLIIPEYIGSKRITSIGEYAFYNCSSLTSITIPSSVTSIGDRAFQGCDSLTSITIPSSVTSIGDRAFQGCDSLTSITFAEGSKLTSIGEWAFYNCSSLTSITIPSSVTSIGEWAFWDCSSLTSITFAEGSKLTSIGKYAFYNCSSLTSITIPSSVTSIGLGAFAYCDDLTSITIPSSVTSIGDAAFVNCDSLTSITIPSSVTSVDRYTFQECSSLTSITIPNSVRRISSGVFRKCTSLTRINYTGTKAQWNAIEKSSDWNLNTGNYTIYCTNGTIRK